MIAQGCPPATISSDIHVFSGNSAGQPYLTNVMSKFMNLGFSLEQVLTMATATPAKVINRIPKHGTLQVGAPPGVTATLSGSDPAVRAGRLGELRAGESVLVTMTVAGAPSGRPAALAIQVAGRSATGRTAAVASVAIAEVGPPATLTVVASSVFSSSTCPMLTPAALRSVRSVVTNVVVWRHCS